MPEIDAIGEAKASPMAPKAATKAWIKVIYDRVVIPRGVLVELTHPKAPVVVKTWAAALPAWVEVRIAPHAELDEILDAGEAEAIILA